MAKCTFFSFNSFATYFTISLSVDAPDSLASLVRVKVFLLNCGYEADHPSLADITL